MCAKRRVLLFESPLVVAWRRDKTFSTCDVPCGIIIKPRRRTHADFTTSMDFSVTGGLLRAIDEVAMSCETP